MLRELTSCMSVSGFERRAAESLVPRFKETFAFDEVNCDCVGNLILKRYAPVNTGGVRRVRLMLDAHIDEIGFIVSEIRDDGLISVVPSGGIDTLILPAAEVTVHGREKLCGIVTDVPENISAPPKIEELYIDTGYPACELRERVSIGDPVTYSAQICRLGASRLLGRAFDDKACAAALICAVADAPREEIAFDIAVVLSTREEIGGGGVAAAAIAFGADAVIVTDGNFAAAPGVPEDDSAPLGNGPMISISAVTDRRLTSIIRRTAEAEGIVLSPVVEACSTGTNASCLYTCRSGVPCAVLSLPLSGMHTASECIDIGDVNAMIRLVGAIITSHRAAGELSEVLDYE